MRKTVTIKPNDAGQRLDKFLTKTFTRLPVSEMYKRVRQKDIRVNGKRAQIDYRLQEGDTVTVYVVQAEFLDEAPPVYDFLTAAKQLDIVYEDDNLLLLNKKAGLLVHPDDKEFRDTLIARVQRYLYEKGEYDPGQENSFAPALVNRIDRNTCGIVIAAKNAAALRILNDKLKKREIHKFYLCIVHGVPAKREDTLEGFLEKNEKQNRVYVSAHAAEGARSIATRYRVLEEKNGLALLEIELLTGRTHQIRATMADLGCPLLGDGKYGSGAKNRQYGETRQALYSYQLTFDFPTDAGILNYLKGRSFRVEQVPFREKYFGGKK